MLQISLNFAPKERAESDWNRPIPSLRVRSGDASASLAFLEQSLQFFANQCLCKVGNHFPHHLLDHFPGGFRQRFSQKCFVVRCGHSCWPGRGRVA